MSYELDHIFILTSKGAPEAQLLIDFGLTEGPNRVHKGQGTQNRCFFFNNVMIELLWVYDEHDAQNEVTTPTTLWSRWNQRNKNASSFGICLRSIDKIKNVAPFKSWKYQPDLFPKPMYVSIANSVTSLQEPLIFFSPMGHRPDCGGHAEIKDRTHKIGFKELTAIKISKPKYESSEAFDALTAHKILTLNPDESNKLELQFDNAKNNKSKDFSPELPLILRW